MKKNLLLLMMCVVLAFSWTKASAVSLSFADGVATLDFDGTDYQMLDSYGNITNEFNNGGWGAINNNNLTKLIVKGTIPSANRDKIFEQIKNKFDQNKRTQTLDMSQMKGMTLDQLKNIQLCAAKIILPIGMDLPDADTYVASNDNGWNPKWQSKGYICTLSEEGGTVTIAGQKFDNRNGESVIANDLGYNTSSQSIDDSQTIYPFSNATKIELVSGVEGNGNDANYTHTDVLAIEKFNAASAVTTYENGVLTLAEGDDTQETLPGKVQELNALDADKVVFPDGSVWEKSTGKLTATANAEAHAAALGEAGFQVSSTSTVQKLGKYVSIVDGVTIFTVPNDNTTSVLGNNIDSNLLTDAEKEALKSATNLKLVGKITKDDWNALNDKAGINPEGHKINSLDLSDAIINDGNSSEPFVLKNGAQFAQVSSIVLPNDPNYKAIPYQFATGTNISSINIPAQVEVIGENAFHACASLATVTWDQNGNLKDIQKNAFSDCNISGDIVIPPSVEKIGDYAFANASHISSVTFPKGSKLSKYYGADNGIGDHAFWMNNNNDLKNVYVLEDEHLLACHHDAFDYDNTDGQTQMATVKTRLHYPPELYYYYVGEWKSRVNEGKVEGQEDLLALRNCVDNGTGTFKRRWVDENNQYHEQMITITLTEEELQWVNGFQKFVSSGIPVTFDTQWRTYSDVVNIKVPAGGESNGVKVADVYIVCGYESGKVILKKMVKDDIIPAHTGILIRHYVTDQANGGVLNFPHVTNEEAATLTGDWDKPYRFVRDGDSRMTYHADAHEFSTGISTRKYFPTGEDLEGSDYEEGYPNYLEFLDCKGKMRIIYNAENDNIIDWPTLEMEPYKGQKVTYRNFVFGNGQLIQHAKEVYEQYGDDPIANPEKYGDYTGADWNPEVQGKMGWGFFRCISRDYKVNSKAFLHYPAEVFKNPKGGSPEAIIDGEVIAGAKPMELQFFEDEGPFIYEIEVSGIATSIRQIDDAEQQDYDYYTIQGVKVKKPSQNGIYIHNGKKIVVK